MHFGDYFIRGWKPANALSLVRYANNYNVWTNLDDRFPHPYTYTDAQDWIAKCRSGQEQGFAIANRDVASVWTTWPTSTAVRSKSATGRENLSGVKELPPGR
jgi:hypothetical protein